MTEPKAIRHPRPPITRRFERKLPTRFRKHQVRVIVKIASPRLTFSKVRRPSAQDVAKKNDH